MSCIRCGEDGKCKNGTTETLVECAENELTCMLTSEHEEQFIYEVKNCYSTGQNLKYVGCLKITSDMPGGVSIKATHLNVLQSKKYKFCIMKTFLKTKQGCLRA